ncbi:MAG TPA: hypothetical protein VGL20_22210 [Candidatus Dormibacteraeota bacterium]
MLTRIVKSAAAGSAAAVLLLGATTVSSASVGAPPLAPQPPAPDPVLPVPAPLPAAHPSRVVPAAPPPEGAATASGLRITRLGICVSCTNATAGPADGGSGATALQVLGNDLAGGSSSGLGSQSGALVAVPANPILTLALAEWIAETRANGSHAKTALIDLVILPHGHESGGTATVCVVDTESQDTTQKTDDTSKSTDAKDEHHGRSSGDAARADAGDGAMMVAVAHSDASSDGMGKAYVAGVGKQELVSSQQSGEAIPVKVAGVDVIAVHHDPSDVPNTQSSVVQADDTAAQPEKPAPIAGAVTASAASIRTPATTPVTSAGQPPATGAGGSIRGVGIPSTGSALAAAGVPLLLAGALLAALSLRRRRA